MTYIITRFLESIESPFLTSISSLKVLDWFLIVLVIGLGFWIGYTVYRDYKNKKEGVLEFYKRSGIQIPFDKLEEGEYKISLLGITLESLNQKIFSLTNILKNSEIHLLICNPNSPLLAEIEKMVNAN